MLWPGYQRIIVKKNKARYNEMSLDIYVFCHLFINTFWSQKLVNFPEIPKDILVFWSTGKVLLYRFTWTDFNKNYTSGKLALYRQ